jgi:hypothetical protein
MTGGVAECVGAVLKVLRDVGVPTPGSALRQARQAKALMALMGAKSVDDLRVAKSLAERGLVTREIIEFENRYLGEKIGMGSYDDIRRKDLKPSALANVAIQEAGRAKNDGTRKWGISPEAAKVFQAWGSDTYEGVMAAFVASRGRLEDELRRARELAMVPVTIPGGKIVRLGGGGHDELIRDSIEQFLPRYGYGAEVAYFADATDRALYVNQRLMDKLSLPSLDDGDLLPDVISFSHERGWLYLIEAVHSTGPISAEKRLLLSRRFAACTAPIVYVTTFASRSSFRSFAPEIGWETEVWIADEPDHLIHFNGDRFLGPYD